MTFQSPDTPLPARFRRVAWSNLAAQSAEQIALAAAPIVAVLALGASAAETGLLQTILTLPFVLFAVPAGLLADRLSRRRLMAGAEALRAAALLATLVLAAFGGLSWQLLAALGFVSVCGTVMFSVAAPALIPSLVPGAFLSTANARIELARTTAFAGGPALGGALVGWIGAAGAFGLAALLSLAAVFLLSRIEEPRREPVPPRHPLAEIRDGAAFVLRHELLLPVFMTQVVFNAAFFLLLAVFVPYAVAVFVPYAVHVLALSETTVGLTLGMMGAGMMVGAVLAPAILRVLPFGLVVAIGPLCGFAAAVAMAMTIVWPRPVLAVVSFFLLGVGPILWVISTTTLRQSVTPPRLLGRVSAINIMSYGARPLGSAMGAVVGGLAGAEMCLYLAAAIFAVQALVIWLSPAVALDRQPDMVPDEALACAR